MNFNATLQLLGGAPLGLFGAGHLGRAVAQGLLGAGFPGGQLVICHRGTVATEQELAQAGLAAHVASREAVTGASRILFYLVRPQDYQALDRDRLPKDGLQVSFLAGIPLNKLPRANGTTRWVRVMPSSPDTMLNRNGIAALYPENAVVSELLTGLGLRLIPLKQEEDFHSFTALGPCLPLALTLWESLGKPVDEQALRTLGEEHGLPNYGSVIAWAQQVCPKGLSAGKRASYLRHAATPGGITEAIFKAIHGGSTLPEALEQGIERGLMLARS